MNDILKEKISNFYPSVTTPKYVLPKIDVLPSGTYQSEITNVTVVSDAQGSSEALDFYHKLIGQNRMTYYVRFRYYENELRSLARVLSQYPNVEAWIDAISLKEVLEINKRPRSQYMWITGRKLSQSNVSFDLDDNDDDDDFLDDDC